MYSNKLICNILIYIDNNLNNKISIDELSNLFFYNRYYIIKLFKQEIGLSITEYINSLRIYNAIKQIKNSDNSLMNICLKNGFYSLEYFSETFKQIANVSPRKIKNYFFKKEKLTENEINLITSAIVNLYEISKIKDNYLSRQQPVKSPVKKLTIFK